MPGVLSIVDGTHVTVSALPNAIEHAYMNRKGFHSINVQIACDSKMLITNINARFPGSTHDSYIFLGSQLFNFLNQLYLQNPYDLNFILGILHTYCWNVKYLPISFQNVLRWFWIPAFTISHDTLQRRSRQFDSGTNFIQRFVQIGTFIGWARDWPFENAFQMHFRRKKIVISTNKSKQNHLHVRHFT